MAPHGLHKGAVGEDIGHAPVQSGGDRVDPRFRAVLPGKFPCLGRELGHRPLADRLQLLHGRLHDRQAVRSIQQVQQSIRQLIDLRENGQQQRIGVLRIVVVIDGAVHRRLNGRARDRSKGSCQGAPLPRQPGGGHGLRRGAALGIQDHQGMFPDPAWRIPVKFGGVDRRHGNGIRLPLQDILDRAQRGQGPAAGRHIDVPDLPLFGCGADRRDLLSDKCDLFLVHGHVLLKIPQAAVPVRSGRAPPKPLLRPGTAVPSPGAAGPPGWPR